MGMIEPAPVPGSWESMLLSLNAPPSPTRGDAPVSAPSSPGVVPTSRWAANIAAAMQAEEDERCRRDLAVFGATGRVGSACAFALLRSDASRGVRCVVRDASSVVAVELAELGADVVECDLRERESVARALDGCAGCFVALGMCEDQATLETTIVHAASASSCVEYLIKVSGIRDTVGPTSSVYSGRQHAAVRPRGLRYYASSREPPGGASRSRRSVVESLQGSNLESPDISQDTHGSPRLSRDRTPEPLFQEET